MAFVAFQQIVTLLPQEVVVIDTGLDAIATFTAMHHILALATVEYIFSAVAVEDIDTAFAAKGLAKK